MTVIVKAGNQAVFYVPTEQSVTFAPGGDGSSLVFGCSSQAGQTRPVDRILYEETAITIPAGSTVFVYANGADASYSDIVVSGGGGSWGNVTGTLSAQTDLQEALDAKQAYSAKLAAVAAVGATPGVVENTGAGTATVRAIGSTNSTDIPTRAHIDARHPRVYTSLPATDAAAANQRGILIASGYPGVLIESNGSGVWSVTDASVTFANMLLIASPAAGMTVTVSTIAMGGDIGTRTVNAPFRYDGTYWKPLYPLILDSLTAATSNVLNSSGNDLALRSCAPPAGLIHPGAYVKWEYLSRPTVTTGDTARINVMDNMTTVIASQQADSAGKQHGVAYLFSHAANRLTGGGATPASTDVNSSTTADVTTAADFNGTRTLDLSVNFVTGDSSKSMALAMSHLVLYPYHNA